MLILESHRFWVGPEIAIKSIEHENAQENTKYCFLSKWLLSLSRKPTFQTFLQVLCGPWKMLKKSKDTVPFGKWCFQFFVRFWKDTNETFQKWQEKCTKTYLCEDYIYYAWVENFLHWGIFCTGFMSTCDMQTPFFTLSSPRLLWYSSLYMAFDEIKHSTLVKKGSVLLNLQWYFFVLKRKFILFCSLRLIPITNGHPVGTTFLIQCHTQKSSGLGKIYSTCTNMGYYGK